MVLGPTSFASLQGALRKGSFYSTQLSGTPTFCLCIIPGNLNTHFPSYQQEVKPLVTDLTAWIRDHTGWFAHFKYKAALSSSQCFPVLVLTVRQSFVWRFSGKRCQRAITLHLWNHQDLIACPSKRRLSFLLPLNRWIILSQTCSWIQKTQTTPSTEHKQLREAWKLSHTEAVTFSPPFRRITLRPGQ